MVLWLGGEVPIGEGEESCGWILPLPRVHGKRTLVECE